MNLIKAIHVPKNTIVINSNFADDTLLFIQNSKIKIANVMGVLDLYCSILGSKLAHHKIEFLMISFDPFRS